MKREQRFNEPRQVGELLELILAELKYQNSRRDDLEKRLRALESKDRVMSIEAAAEYCDVARQTIGNWIRQGKLTKVTKNGKIGILLSELKTVKQIN